MRCGWLLLASCVLILVELLTNVSSISPPLFEDDSGYPQATENDYSENDIDGYLRPAQKRACVRRGGNCDHRPNDCCYNSSCRCNLWGANCRCQRMGLFQKWG